MCHSDKRNVSHGACCCGCGSIRRHFLTTKEKQETLEKRRDELKKEISGIEERIQELKS